MYDLLIKRATVIDGTGQESFVADIGISDGRIIDIALDIPVKAKEVIEAEGLVLAPGFIDVQNHSDSYWSLFDSPNLDSLVLQGITSVLVGNCGTSLAPLLSRNALKSSQKWHDLTGSNFNWSSFGEFADTLGSQNFGTNVGSLVGLSTLRRGLLGDQQRSLSPEEVEILGRALQDSIEAGAFGLSTGLSYSHEFAVSELELYELAKIVTAYNALLSVHLRNEAEGLPESVEEALEVAQKSGSRLKLSHFKVRGKSNWHELSAVLQRIENVVHMGADISFDVYPYTSTWQPLYTYLPKWAISGGRAAMLKILGDPVQYKKILAHLHASQNSVAELIVASTSFNMRVVSKNLGQIAQNLGVSSEEALLEVLKNGGTEVLVFDHCLHADQVEELLAHPLSVVGTDGGGFPLLHQGQHVSKLVHPRCFGTTSSFIAQMRHSKRISLEAAVAKLTSLPARVWGLSDRGKIGVGSVADLVLFDPLHTHDRATIQNPYRAPQGIHKVWVNGALVASEGQLTGIRSGTFLRKE